MTRTVLIAGLDRPYAFGDAAFVCDALDKLHAEAPITKLYENGTQDGAAVVSMCWAVNHGVEHETYLPAAWRSVKPDVVVAFPGRSGVVSAARAAAIEVVEVAP